MPLPDQDRLDDALLWYLHHVGKDASALRPAWIHDNLADLFELSPAERRLTQSRWGRQPRWKLLLKQAREHLILRGDLDGRDLRGWSLTPKGAALASTLPPPSPCRGPAPRSATPVPSVRTRPLAVRRAVGPDVPPPKAATPVVRPSHPPRSLQKPPDPVSAVPRVDALAANSPFAAALAGLSVRASNVLASSGVEDLRALLALTLTDLMSFRNCGRKTVAEILDLRASLRLVSPASEDTPPPPTPPLSYVGASTEAMAAVRSKLTVRANHTLDDLAVDSLQAFMALDEDSLLGRSACGKKTARQILNLQADIAEFARGHSQGANVVPVERVLETPCLFGVPREAPCPAQSAAFLADAAQPTPWLARWVSEQAVDARRAQVFMLRMGMLGAAPMTLGAVARAVGGITRERVRQLQNMVAKVAATPYQQRRLRPLVDEAARIVADHGGRMGLDDLTEAVLCRGPDGDQLRHATGLMIFFGGLQVWADAGLQAPCNGIVCDQTREPPDTAASRISRRPAKRSKPLRRTFPVYTQSHLGLDSDFDPDDLTI